MPSKNPSKKVVPLENLLRTLLRSVRLHDPLGVRPSNGNLHAHFLPETWGLAKKTVFGLLAQHGCMTPPSGSGERSTAAASFVHSAVNRSMRRSFAFITWRRFGICRFYMRISSVNYGYALCPAKTYI